MSPSARPPGCVDPGPPGPAHDCEFVSAAIGLRVRLVTVDRDVARRSPDVAEAQE